MGYKYILQFRVSSLQLVARVADLLEEEAASEENPEQAGQWREMSRMCRRQSDGRRYKTRTVRPVYASIRWDVVESAVQGDIPCPVLSSEEAREVCRLLTEQGKSAAYIADRVMTHERTVHRWRIRDRDQDH